MDNYGYKRLGLESLLTLLTRNLVIAGTVRQVRINNLILFSSEARVRIYATFAEFRCTNCARKFVAYGQHLLFHSFYRQRFLARFDRIVLLFDPNFIILILISDHKNS